MNKVVQDKDHQHVNLNHQAQHYMLEVAEAAVAVGHIYMHQQVQEVLVVVEQVHHFHQEEELLDQQEQQILVEAEEDLLHQDVKKAKDANIMVPDGTMQKVVLESL